MELSLTNRQIDAIEKIIGKQELWMFNKVWEERNNVLKYLKTVEQYLRICKEHNRVELRYWQVKEKEVWKVIEHQTKTLQATIKLLDGKLKQSIVEQISSYLNSVNRR